VSIDMSEAVGAENMNPDAKETVIQKLSGLPLLAAEIKHAFFSWARQAGYSPTSADALRVAGIRKKRTP
jgi:hypothetical protein